MNLKGLSELCGPHVLTLEVVIDVDPLQDGYRKGLVAAVGAPLLTRDHMLRLDFTLQLLF